MQTAWRWIFLVVGLGAVAAGCGTKSSTQSEFTLCLMDSGSGSDHERKVTEALTNLLTEKGWSESKIRRSLLSLPIYDESGSLRSTQFVMQIERARTECDVVHLSWNLPRSSQTVQIERELDELSRRKVVVMAAGSASGSGSAALRTTVAGQVSQALVVAEATIDGRLHPSSNTGSEIVVALPAPLGYEGSSFSSLVLTAEIAARWNTRTSAEWLRWAQQAKTNARQKGRYLDIQKMPL